ncbi:MAG: M20/M25/M40 family metallo-hydrolase [Sphingobacteriales bacterium]|nr:M20/M25/M40 family metallo-hydrolase [Sphingobacteriales bacterium]
MKKILLLSYCMICSLFAFSQNEDSLMVRRIADDILINGKAYDDLRYLCKKIGARLSGSANAQKAVEATATMLKEAGADTVYLQPCMVPHWIRGAKEQGIVQWGKNKKALNVCALGMSVGTPASGLKAELIEVANFEELKKLGAEKVKGKIVFFNYPMKPELIFNGYGDAVRYRGSGPVEAAKLGAVAVMIRSVTHALDNNPHTGATRYDSTVNKIPAMACSTLDAEWLHELFKKEKKVELFMKMSCEKLPDVLSYNVIGEIRGTEKPEEIITAGGHLDSWDLGEGAHDDGAGCVQSIQIIRTIKNLGIKPKRTIRAVMFMNEENGLAGGTKYAELAGINKENHIFAIESDAGGFGVETLGLTGKPEQVNKVRSWLPLFRPYGIYDMPDGGGGADIGPLRKYGTFMCSVNPGTQRYFDYHHAPNDKFEAVHKRELEMGAIGMTAIVYLVAQYGL